MLIQGVLLNHKVCFGSPKVMKSAKILITRMDLASWRTNIWGTQITVESHEEGAIMAQLERTRVRERCQKIIDMGINVIVNQGQLYSVAEQL